MRKPIIAGNWKMNMTSATAAPFVKELAPLVKNTKHEVVLCVPYTLIEKMVSLTKKTNIKIGSQNVAWADNGAFTGEVNAAQLKEVGASYAIIGHSERRQMFGETDDTVNKRTIQAVKNGLVAIVCVGETLKERETNITEQVIKAQVNAAFSGIPASDLKNIVIAYEPVWAIGTGKTATSLQAEETIAFTRKTLAEIYNKEAADTVRIQYGGSMNATNVDELMAQPNIDGGLIGGASLKPTDFARIVNYN